MSLYKIEETSIFIKNVLYAFVEDVFSINYVLGVAEVVFNENKSWLGNDFVFNSIKFSQKQKNQSGNPFWEQKLVFDFAGSDATVNDFITTAPMRGFIFALVYNNGTAKLFGTVENWARMAVDTDFQQFEDINGFTFTRDGDTPIPFLTYP